VGGAVVDPVSLTLLEIEGSSVVPVPSADVEPAEPLPSADSIPASSVAHATSPIANSNSRRIQTKSRTMPRV
jgi:hypothetical protein